MNIQTPKGTKDILGREILVWQKLENMIRQVSQSFGFGEIRTPIFEYTELFTRGVGETTDVVQKEMYTFLDKQKRSLTLRPEMTASAARALVEHNLCNGVMPAKYFYIGPCFRYEQPQAGRMRQFHQFGVELYGAAGPEADAEVIAVGYTLLHQLQLKNIELHINSLGGKACREKYNRVLQQFIQDNLDRLCPTCRERAHLNPLRVLDCKEEKCRNILEGAPSSIDTLDTECRNHFEQLKQILTDLSIPFVVDTRLVRGLDYYTRTVFEFISGDIGAQGTVCGGGRYDGLIEECGGPSLPAVGYAMGMERLIMAQNILNVEPSRMLFIGHMGDTAAAFVRKLLQQLRMQGFDVEGDLLNRTVKAQMKYADRIGARFSLIVGDNELNSGQATVKNMQTGEQTSVKLDALDAFLRQPAADVIS